MAEDKFTIWVDTTKESVDVSKYVLQYSINLSYIDLVDTFTVKLYAPDAKELSRLVINTRPWTLVTLYINNYVQMEGVIDAQTLYEDGLIEIRGRDYLGVFMSSCSIGKVVVPTGINIGDALLKGLGQFGITEVLNGFNVPRNQMSSVQAYTDDPLVDYKTVKVTEKHGKPNEAVSQFCIRLLKRSGLFLLPSISRHQIALGQPEYRQKPLYTLKRLRTKLSNILSGNVTRDYTNVPTSITWKGATPIKLDDVYSSSEEIYKGAAKYITNPETLPHAPRRKSTTIEYPVFGEKSPHPLGLNDEVKSLIRNRVIMQRDETGAPGNGNRLYRPLVISDSDSKNTKELFKAAERELSTRLRDTLQVAYTVNGHSYTNGAIYTIDTMVSIEDDVGKVYEDLWINRVTHRRTRVGSETEIEAWRPSSYYNEG